MPRKFIVEGLDFLGKSTLIEGIRNKLGYFEVIHYQKPQLLDFYNKQAETNAQIFNKTESQWFYQRDSFITMFNILRSEANVILDRAHLGEMVYAPIYRGYSGEYVLGLERAHDMHLQRDVRLILLTEDFEISKHFVDDGESFDVTKRQQEQELIVDAFNRSRILDKRIICVTDPGLGGFKPREWILDEALRD